MHAPDRDVPLCGQAPVSYTEEERVEALFKVQDFASSDEFADMVDLVWGGFWCGIDEEELPTDEAREAGVTNFSLYLGVTAELRGGKRPIDLLLDRADERLGPGERRFLEVLARTPFTLHEVLERKGDDDAAHVRVLLREFGPRADYMWVVWGDELPAPKPGQVVAGRFVARASGLYAAGGDVYALPAESKGRILAALEKLRRSSENQGERDPHQLQRRVALTFPRLWLSELRAQHGWIRSDGGFDDWTRFA